MTSVLTVNDIGRDVVAAFLARYRLELVVQAACERITGSFWGESEAGVVGTTVYVRGDTPVHSFLHESSHIICMDSRRRSSLDRDAGSDDLEESAVCYLQILLADHLAGVGRLRLMADMDAWGYSFRLGSTRNWFESDAEEAKEFLFAHGLIDDVDEPTFILRS
ncbi:MAG: hypothetical protein WBM45_13290 [Woeseiaceae bacterium]